MGDLKLGGVLLTGGASRRMGLPKALLRLPSGETLARRLGAILADVCEVTYEVGLGASQLPRIFEPHPKGGPAQAAQAGIGALLESAELSGAVILGCDLPLLARETLFALDDIRGDKSLVVIVGGRRQLMCTLISRAAMERIVAVPLASGSSMGDMLARVGDLVEIDLDPKFPDIAGQLLDCDTREEFRRLLGVEANL